jgi:hypothetical protein
MGRARLSDAAHGIHTLDHSHIKAITAAPITKPWAKVEM